MKSDRASVAKAIRQKYARIAPSYDRWEALPDRLLLTDLRRRLLARATGRVLEIGMGTGRNLPYYAPACTVTGTDVSEAMLAQARRRARDATVSVGLCQMDAEGLAFPEAVFDTVLCSLSLCTIPDPVQAAREMARVCRPTGRLLFLEHVRSPVGWVGWFQDRLAPWQYRNMCCRLNQNTQELLSAAGIEPVLVAERLWGVFVLLEARPRD